MPDTSTAVAQVHLLDSGYSREARSLLYHAYRHEPTFAYLFEAERSGYEQRVRATVRELVKQHFLQELPAIGLLVNDRLIGIALIAPPQRRLGITESWAWQLRMWLSTGFRCTRRYLEYHQAVLACLPSESVHVLPLLGVHPQFQGKHYGEQLLEAVHNWCAEDPHSQGVVLDTGNPLYLEFYKRQGYAEVAEVAVGPILEHVFFHPNPQVCGALAQSELDVRVKPSNDALKANIEGYIGGVGERDEEALQRFSRGAEEQARKAAQALGFYQPQIASEVKPGKNPRLILSIDPGEPVHLRNVTIRVDGPAAELKSFRVPDSKDLKSGAVLNHGHYEDAKRLIQNQASRFGYFSGRFTRQTLSVDPQAGVADIELVYDSGPRYTLGKVNFAGDTPFDEELLQRMVPFKSGAPYDSELIAELNQALQSSGYFEGVRVDAAPAAAANDVIPVAVQLETRKPRTMGLGLGFSTDVGPRGKANWTRHWVNPQGHSYGWEAELSAPRQNVGLWYDIPLDPPLTDKLRFAGGYQNEELANTDTLSKLLTLGPEWHSKLPSGWTRVISLKWQREEYRLGDDSGLSNLLMPGISYSYLRSDNRIDPHNGYRLQFDTKV
eukprot:gene13421-13197_t